MVAGLCRARGQFKEVNHANAVLSNPSKRKIYDEYGEMGLKMMDQFGEDAMKYVLNPWMKVGLCPENPETQFSGW